VLRTRRRRDEARGSSQVALPCYPSKTAGFRDEIVEHRAEADRVNGHLCIALLSSIGRSPRASTAMSPAIPLGSQLSCSTVEQPLSPREVKSLSTLCDKGGGSSSPPRPATAHERAGAPRASQTITRTTVSKERSGTALSALLQRHLSCRRKNGKKISSPHLFVKRPPRARRCPQSAQPPHQDQHERPRTAPRKKHAAPATPAASSGNGEKEELLLFSSSNGRPELADASKAAQPLNNPSLGISEHSATASHPQHLTAKREKARSCRRVKPRWIRNG
jgi:hypothetical protein